MGKFTGEKGTMAQAVINKFKGAKDGSDQSKTTMPTQNMPTMSAKSHASGGPLGPATAIGSSRNPIASSRSTKPPTDAPATGGPQGKGRGLGHGKNSFKDSEL